MDRHTMSHEIVKGSEAPDRAGAMQDPGYGPPRIYLLDTSVNSNDRGSSSIQLPSLRCGKKLRKRGDARYGFAGEFSLYRGYCPGGSGGAARPQPRASHSGTRFGGVSGVGSGGVGGYRRRISLPEPHAFGGPDGQGDRMADGQP